MNYLYTLEEVCRLIKAMVGGICFDGQRFQAIFEDEHGCFLRGCEQGSTGERPDAFLKGKEE